MNKIAQETSRWFRRNGSQVGEGDRGFLGFTIYLRIVPAQGAS